MTPLGRLPGWALAPVHRSGLCRGREHGWLSRTWERQGPQSRLLLRTQRGLCSEGCGVQLAGHVALQRELVGSLSIHVQNALDQAEVESSRFVDESQTPEPGPGWVTEGHSCLD